MRRPPLTALLLLALAALVACSGTKDVLEPSSVTPPGQSVAGATQPPLPSPSPSPGVASQAAAPSPAAPAAPAAPQNPALIAKARVQFAPIVGTSVEAASALSERITSRARERGITLAASTDPAATHVLKGYFTPLTENKQTTIIFVWDVYDPAGNRIHRISGQQKIAGATGEGWQAVPPAAMRAIAETTIDELAVWLATRPA